MGMDYIHHTMVGVLVRGSIKELYYFLEKNGYLLTDEQKTEIMENGCFNEDIIEMLDLGDIDIVRLNCWAGDDHIIGYHVANESETEQYATMLSKYFPNSKAEFHDFTQIG